MRYTFSILLLLFSVTLFSQIGSSGIGGNKSDVTGDFEKVCYSDGVDTLTGYINVQGKTKRIYDYSYNYVAGAIALPPELCEYRPSECVESQEWTYAVDNTGTSFAEDNTIMITLSDGTSFSFNQPPATGWTPQMQVWGDEIQAAADASGLAWFVETRFIAGSGSLVGGGGFSGPPSVPVSTELYKGGMRWRYVNIQICPGQPTPVAAEIIDSSNPNRIGYNLTSAGPVKGPLQKFFVCRDCGKEPVWYLEDGLTLANTGQIPNCFEPCGVISGLPAPPENDCTYEIDVACDNNNQNITANFTNTITRRATVCNGEQIAVDYYQADPTDANALISYDLVGDFVDCATGEEVPEPEPLIIVDECIKNEICIDGNKNGWQVKTIATDGVLTTTYEDNNGVIPEPTNWDIGTCDCEALDYWTLENYTDGLIRSEYLTGNAAQGTANWGDDDIAAGIMDDFILNTPTTAPNVVTGGFILNDTDNTASLQDIEYKEGYIIVKSPISIFYNTNSEGAIRLELGSCCGELVEQFTHAKNVGDDQSPTIELPIGIHKIKLTNLDMGGSNSNWNLYVSYDGINYALDNTPNDVLFSSTKPKQECKKGYLCSGETYELDMTTPLAFSDIVLACEIKCNVVESAEAEEEPSLNIRSISEIEVCADGSPAVQKTILDSEGVETVTFYNSSGNITPTNVVAGSCTKTSECVKWRNKYLGIDNTGTSFSTTYEIEVREGTDVIGTFTQTPSANNTIQLNQWIAGLQVLYPNALIEQRYAPSGGAGLPPPTAGVDFTQMAARYVQFTACDGDDLPTDLFIISENSIPFANPIQMDTEVIFGDEVRGYVCYECGIEPVVYYTDGTIVELADIPPCYVTCAEGFKEEDTTTSTGDSPTAQEIADAIQANERNITTRILNVQNNTNDVTLGVPAGTMGCIKVVEDIGTGLVYWNILGLPNPGPSDPTTFVTTGPYHAAYNVCGIDLSLVVFNGSSTGSDYSIIYEIWN